MEKLGITEKTKQIMITIIKESSKHIHNSWKKGKTLTYTDFQHLNIKSKTNSPASAMLYISQFGRDQGQFSVSCSK